MLDIEIGVSPDTVALLKGMGYSVRLVPWLANVEAILISNGWCTADAMREVSGQKLLATDLWIVGKEETDSGTRRCPVCPSSARNRHASSDSNSILSS